MQLNLWYVPAALLFLVGLAGSIFFEIYTVRMIGTINRARPGEPPISTFGWYGIERYVLIYREYRRLAPDGTLHTARRIAFTVSCVGYMGCWLCMVMIVRG